MNTPSTDLLPGLRTCPDCGVPPGQPHQGGCDVERCTVCGGQVISCRFFNHCTQEGHDPSFARWTGLWPGKAESQALGIDLNAFMANGYAKLFFVKPQD